MQDGQDENPYRSPENEALAQATTGAGLSETALFYLKGTHGWLRFLGIMGFIGCGFLVLTGVFMLIFTNEVIGEIANEVSELGGVAGIFKSITGSVGPFVGAIYAAMAVLYFFPSKFCWDFGSKIRKFLVSNAAGDLEAALKSNKSLFKFFGILTITGLALIPVTIIITVIAIIVSGL
ncbi:hypothetical protein FACS1894190_14960 [Spirochaetia bacterium]|nr:hypothetical protein FACS1894190_14960 [Spirochaetia bacterium]